MAKKGTYSCLCCKHEVVVKENDGGTLSFACPYCDLSAWAKKGTEAARIVGGLTKWNESAKPADVPAAKPAPAAASRVKLPHER